MTRKRVSAVEVERAADALMRAGERPTIERIRKSLGGGSPNTINPLLDAWWKRLGARVDAGPAALARLPETVAHVAEALWLQALQEARGRAQLELGGQGERARRQEDELEVRSHVLSLREGELNERLADKGRRIAQLELELREARLTSRKETATIEALRVEVSRLTNSAARGVRPKQRSSAPRPVKRSPATSSLVRRRGYKPLNTSRARPARKHRAGRRKQS